MADSDNIPVIIGVGRITQRPQGKGVDGALDPIGLFSAAARLAAADACMDGSGSVSPAELLSCVDNVSTVNMMLEERVPKERRPLYKNPSKGLAQALGAKPDVRTAMSFQGGQSPQLLVNELAERLAAGKSKVGIVAGGECLQTFMRATKLGLTVPGVAQVRDAAGRTYQGGGGVLPWGDDPSFAEPERVGHDERVATRQEALHGLASPPNCYALLDQALRHHLGRSSNEHLQINAEVFAGFSRVAGSAALAPHAWLSQARSAQELATITENNRAVTLPGYPKFLNAFQDVDQAAAVILATTGEARRLRVPESQWVYLHGTADVEESPLFITQRPELHRCKGMAAMGQEVQRAANVPVSKCEHLDIYSCFPVAVEMACRELGIDSAKARDGTQLTLLGGLPYHGGPGNAYTLLALAAMCERLRAKPRTFGLVTANGGFVTKHSAAILSTTPYQETHPHARSWQRRDPAEYQQVLDAEAGALDVAAAPSGRGTVETCTVEYGRDGPVRAIFIGRLLEKGYRFIATSRDPAAIKLVQEGGGIGVAGSVSTDAKGERSTFVPDGIVGAAKL